MTENSKENAKSGREFAAMTPEPQKELASQGGQAAHKQSTAHKSSKNEPAEPGKKGGQMPGFKRRRPNDGHEELL